MDALLVEEYLALAANTNLAVLRCVDEQIKKVEKAVRKNLGVQIW